jgi:hypothetical protein
MVWGITKESTAHLDFVTRQRATLEICRSYVYRHPSSCAAPPKASRVVWSDAAMTAHHLFREETKARCARLRPC